MATTITRRPLSADASGAPILIASTSSTSPNTIHTSTYTYFDDVMLFAGVKAGGVDGTLYLQIGDVVSQCQLMAGAGMTQVLAGSALKGSATTIKAYANTANNVFVFGYVNRVTN